MKFLFCGLLVKKKNRLIVAHFKQTCHFSEIFQIFKIANLQQTFFSFLGAFFFRKNVKCFPLLRNKTIAAMIGLLNLTPLGISLNC